MVAATQPDVSFGESATPQLHFVPVLSSPTEQLSSYHTIHTVRENIEVIEVKLARRIKLPSRPLTVEEEGLIAFVRTALQYGEAVQTWAWVTVPVNRAQAQGLVDDFAGGVVRKIWLSRAEGERFVLFGTVVPLGSTHILLPQARLINEQEVRTRLAEQVAEDERFLLTFSADCVNLSVFRYDNWMPGNGNPTATASPQYAMSVQNPHQIVREFPGRWFIRVSTDRSGLTDLLNPAVIVALEQLDHAEYERILRALTVLWQWRVEHNPDWTTKRLPGGNDLELLEFSADLGLIVQQETGKGPTVIEIVRPRVLQGASRGA